MNPRLLVRVLGAIPVALIAVACSPGDPARAAGDVEAGTTAPLAFAGSTSQATAGDASAGKRALVIALGDYPDPNVNGYRRINSANDVPLIEAALRAQGFTAVRTLRREEGDRAGVLRALEELISASRSDDVVVVHYSGHGDQAPDDNGDEIDG